MKLYLMRHGEYLQDSRTGGALSEKGKKDINRLGDFLRHMHLNIPNVIHSERLRAQQTAELITQHITFGHPPTSRKGLDPMDPVEDFIDEIYAQKEDWMIVGHLPFMSRLVSKLLTGVETNEIVMFQPATIVCLEKITMEIWSIIWVINPQLIPE